MAVTKWSIRGEGRAQAPGDVISNVGVDRDRRNQLDDARARAKAGQRINDQRKAMGEVIAGTAIEPHSRAPSLRAMTRKPSCLISCSHISPEGGRSAFVGRHGAINPAGRGRSFNTSALIEMMTQQDNFWLGKWKKTIWSSSAQRLRVRTASGTMSTITCSPMTWWSGAS